MEFPVTGWASLRPCRYGKSDTVCWNLWLRGVEMVGTINTRIGIFWPLSVITFTIATSVCCALLLVLPNDDKYIVSVPCMGNSSSWAYCSVINDFWAPSSNKMFASVCTSPDDTVAMAVFNSTSLSGRVVHE